MKNERTVFADVGKLRSDSFSKLVALLQRSARIAGSLGVTPYQFIRVQIKRIAGQEMQSQLALRADDYSLTTAFL